MGDLQTRKSQSNGRPAWEDLRMRQERFFVRLSARQNTIAMSKNRMKNGKRNSRSSFISQWPDCEQLQLQTDFELSMKLARIEALIRVENWAAGFFRSQLLRQKKVWAWRASSAKVRMPTHKKEEPK